MMTGNAENKNLIYIENRIHIKEYRCESCLSGAYLTAPFEIKGVVSIIQ